MSCDCSETITGHIDPSGFVFRKRERVAFCDVSYDSSIGSALRCIPSSLLGRPSARSIRAPMYSPKDMLYRCVAFHAA